MSEPDYAKFMEELTELSKKHGVLVGFEAMLSPFDTHFARPTGHYEERHDFLTWINDEPEHTCQFCGMPSYVDPFDQEPPVDYCHHDTPSQ